ncbi:uncharacterized protein LOC143284626 [Babylonia areolata]|uniref:uncharacterized protein LOC143284626 n=1 Tax=Babylonia areolata TaxID=304850 RepID=UPI003FD5469D
MLTLLSALLLLCGEQEGDQSGVCDTQDRDGGGGGESFEDKLNEIMENVMHSKMMEELKALPSEVMEELKNLPGELRESLLLHVERRSLVVAGVVVAVVAALLLLGCVWIHWCHTEHGEYRYIPISQVEEFLRYQNLASSTSSSHHHHGHRHRHKHHGQHHSSHGHRGKDRSDSSQLTHRRTDHNHIANGGQ